LKVRRSGLYDRNKYGPSDALLLEIVSSGGLVVCPFRMATTTLDPLSVHLRKVSRLGNHLRPT
jgi:hypothetical protein